MGGFVAGGRLVELRGLSSAGRLAVECDPEEQPPIRPARMTGNQRARGRLVDFMDSMIELRAGQGIVFIDAARLE
jgi:hypothetical protein